MLKICHKHRSFTCTKLMIFSHLNTFDVSVCLMKVSDGRKIKHFGFYCTIIFAL